MATSISLGEAQEQLRLWREALAKLRISQSYTFSHAETSRTLTRADLAEVRTTVDYWQEQVNRLTAAPQGGDAGGFMFASLK